jgi:hypothetical protein
MSGVLILIVILFLGVNLMVLAFCRSAALADRQMERLHVRRVIDFSTAVTKPTGKRAPSDPTADNPGAVLRQPGLLP